MKDLMKWLQGQLKCSHKLTRKHIPFYDNLKCLNLRNRDPRFAWFALKICSNRSMIPVFVDAYSRKWPNELEIRFKRVLDSILDVEYQSFVPLVRFVTFESRKTFPGISSKLLE